MTLRILKNLNHAGNAALKGKEKSNMIYQHGAVVCKNGKPLVYGFNHKRSYFGGCLTCSAHAEMHVDHLVKLRFGKGKKPSDFKRIIKKFDIYVVRLSNGSEEFLESAP